MVCNNMIYLVKLLARPYLQVFDSFYEDFHKEALPNPCFSGQEKVERVVIV